MRNTSFLFLLVLPVAIILTPAFSPASIYSWQDASGVTTYSNNPPAHSGDAQVAVHTTEVAPLERLGPASAGTMLANADQPQIPERSTYMATQAEFAVQLVKELGLGQPADASQAADVLTDLRIAPALGEWTFDQPMTPELTIRLRQLTVAAAGRGAITITPEQALLAFDTAAALLNVDIPASDDQYTVSDAPYPIADLPPLVDFTSPPSLYYPYYIWTPIAGGFWWGNAFFPGYYVLNVGLFCDHYSDHYYGNAYYNHYKHDGYHRVSSGSRARFASIDPGHISHHVQGHIQDHALRARPAPDGGRMVSSPGQPRSPFPSTSMRSGGSDRAGLRASRPVAAPDRVSFTRSIRSSRAPLGTPGYRSQAYRSPSYRSPSYRSSSMVSRWTGRGAYPSASTGRAGFSGFAPSRSSFHGGMQTTRGGGASFRGGQTQHSAGGAVRAGSSSPGSSYHR